MRAKKTADEREGARDWGPTGPNDEPPNLRLGADEPAQAYWRTGTVQYDFPTTDDGTPDVELQRAGFWHAFAHRVVQISPHYRLITKKGETP